jgi:hypothetical protein
MLRRRSRAAILLVPLLLLAVTPGARADPLADKAASFRRSLVERHLSPEGLLLYRVRGSTIERARREGLYPDLADTPTFTGLLAATSCLRADVAAPDERAEALADAERAIAGLELLTAVTGRPGLLARAVRPMPLPADGSWDDDWFPGGLGFESFSWRGNTSVDQYANGLLPAVWECRHHFPERTRKLVTDFAALLARDGMRLYDPDGRQTTYGDLSWRSGYGFNSIFQLTGYAAFAISAELDPNGPWAETRDRLRATYRVPAGARVTNFRVGTLTNFSNDMMAWNLVPLSRARGDPALADLRHGMHRSWLRVREDENAYFALVLCRIEPEACDPEAVASARRLLEHFPLDKMAVEGEDAVADIPRRWLPGANGKRQARRPVPIELRRPSSYEWKSNPYRVEQYGMLDLEYTGLDYLAAYWLLVSHDTAERPGAR